MRWLRVISAQSAGEKTEKLNPLSSDLVFLYFFQDPFRCAHVVVAIFYILL
jgi:hypothetical protein